MPSNWFFYDVEIPTFTVPGGSVGGKYVIPNTLRSFPIRPALNVKTDQAYQVALLIAPTAHALITTNTADTCYLETQYSTSGGRVWEAIELNKLYLNSNNQNESAINGFHVFNAMPINDAYPIFGGALYIRLAVMNPRSPTTNALTLTNIRSTMQVIMPS